MSEPARQKGDLGRFGLKAVVVAGIAALALLLYQLHDVLLLVFAAILVAVILRSAADGIRRLLPVGQMAALTIGTILILAVVGGIFALFGTQVAAQFQQLGDRLPAAWIGFETWVGPDRLRGLIERFSPEGSTVAGIFQTIFSYLTAALSGLVLAVLGGIYLAIDPATYRRGTLRLLPLAARAQADDAMKKTGRSLRAWLIGQLVSMAIVGTAVFIGMTAIGVPSALALALIAGMMEFIPLAGPLLGALPAVLIAMTVDAQTLGLTILLFFIVQQFEGNVLSPLIMRKTVSIPPAVTLFALFLFGGLFGPIGVLLGGPLTVAAFVLINTLWVLPIEEHDELA